MPASAKDLAAVAYAQNAIPNGDPDHLSSKMCWEAVGYCAYKADLLPQPPAIMDSKGNFTSVEDAKVNGWNAMFNLAPGEVIGFFDLSKKKEDQLAHIMLCVGKGRAAGSNNGCIGGQNVWQILSLDNLSKLKWDADGGVTIDGRRKLEVHHRFLHEMR